MPIVFTGTMRQYSSCKLTPGRPWFQGQVEGTVNKIKTHKRLMYGRARFPLLRQKLLHLTFT